ncbi:hypothetical protein OB905_01420 [Halobacteria archaeon AArc-dxtr1]|nr:hypothetical protein [Halobacteria archaeon AArc-dxtr1]
MTFQVGTVLSKTGERLLTPIGAIVVLGLTLVGIVQTIATQAVVQGFLEWMLTQLDDPTIREEFSADELAELEGQLESAIADISLTFGLSAGQGVLLWVLGFVLSLVVVVVAINAFGHGRDSPALGEIDGFGWKLLNLFVGWIVFGVLFVIGILFFIVPGLVVAFVFVFFAAAVVLDGDSFLSAFASSFGVVRENLLGTAGVIVLCLGAFIGLGIVGNVFGAVLPSTAALVVDDVLTAAAQGFAIALVTVAYVAATGDGAESDEAPSSPDVAFK